MIDYSGSSVHDSSLSAQRVFRKTMNAFAHPLVIYNLGDEVSNSSITLGGNSAITELCSIFLDNCVSFHSDGDEQLTKQLIEMTYARQSIIEDADFVILNEPKGFYQWEKICQGTLVDPHLGATVIINVPQIKGDVSIEAQGPGIKGTGIFHVHNILAECIFSAAKLNIEYPKGFELLFASPQGDICAVGRRVKVNHIR